ncbi:MAG TPA: hypothetical protein PLA65_12045, partial [Spirochaetota bacterium]|nr:hypothetical protein [Spirochaetota bacterium]
MAAFQHPLHVQAPLRQRPGFAACLAEGAFDMPGDPSAYHGISLGRIYYTDSVYVNGIPVGS